MLPCSDIEYTKNISFLSLHYLTYCGMLSVFCNILNFIVSPYIPIKLVILYKQVREETKNHLLIRLTSTFSVFFSLINLFYLIVDMPLQSFYQKANIKYQINTLIILSLFFIKSQIMLIQTPPPYISYSIQPEYFMITNLSL